MSEASQLRAARIQATLLAMDGNWPHIVRELQERREEAVKALIVANDEQTRGRVKQIDDLLLLPNTLRQELKYLSESLANKADS